MCPFLHDKCMVTTSPYCVACGEPSVDDERVGRLRNECQMHRKTFHRSKVRSSGCLAGKDALSFRWCHFTRLKFVVITAFVSRTSCSASDSAPVLNQGVKCCVDRHDTTSAFPQSKSTLHAPPAELSIHNVCQNDRRNGHDFRPLFGCPLRKARKAREARSRTPENWIFRWNINQRIEGPTAL